MTHLSDKPKILIIGDAVAPTGFARVIRSIFEPICDDFEIHQLATRYDGRTHNYPWELYAANKGKSVYGYDILLPLIEEIKPSIVFLLYDISFQIPYINILRKAAHKIKIVFYTPVEAGPIAPEIIRQLEGVTRYVLFTEYGREEIEKSLSAVRKENKDFRFPSLEVIPHGVDKEKFYPMDEPQRVSARKALGFNDTELLNSFIVLNANRNMPRKRIDITMQGFSLFAKEKPANVKLYLHMATEDTGWNVAILAKRYGIFDRLIMTRADNVRPAFSDEQLNLLYNACDVGITTTTGEGWGMVSFEHAATKTAQIVPRHTSLEYLWKDAAEFIEPVMKLTYPGNLTEGHIVAPEGAAAALEKVYTDVRYRDALAEAAYKNATRAEYDWKTIAGKWKELFFEMLNS